MDLQISTVERQRAIQDLIEKDKRVSLTAICEAFSISEATARRDLETLAEEGKVQRVRGGAITTEKSPPEMPILQRENEQTKDKVLIFLGSGTTVLATARHLSKCQDLTVLTNSLPIINFLIGCSGINLIVLGGILRGSELSFIGHITEKALSEVRADKVFMGAGAISLEHGITNDFMAETLTDRAIIQISQKVILVADHTKFGLVSTAFLSPIEDMNVIVTDQKTDREYIQLFREKGIEVILA